MATTEEIKAALLAQKNRGTTRSTERKSKRTGDNALYPFWDAPVGGDPVTLRFLPDGDPENTLFWRPREVIKLTFNGSVGGEYATDKEVEVTVPCVNMFGMKCPIISATKSWWDDPKTEALARKYWKKKSYIFQGFVVSSPIVEEEVPENPIRRFVVNPQIFKVIEEALISGEMEEPPVHYIGGCDFNVKKTLQQKFNNFSTSNWARKSRSLSEDELSAIQTHGLFDLKASLGTPPDADHLAVIEAMFNASLNGEPFDTASFGTYYRAFGARTEGGYTPKAATPAESPAAPATASAPVDAQDAAPAATGASRGAAELLAKIRARTSN